MLMSKKYVYKFNLEGWPNKNSLEKKNLNHVA